MWMPGTVLKTTGLCLIKLANNNTVHHHIDNVRRYSAVDIQTPTNTDYEPQINPDNPLTDMIVDPTVNSDS